MIHVGIDNGVTGSLCVLDGNADPEVIPASEYTERAIAYNGQTITRIWPEKWLALCQEFYGARVLIEFPYAGVGRRAVYSAFRSHEAMLYGLTIAAGPGRRGITWDFVSAPEWRKHYVQTATKRGKRKLTRHERETAIRGADDQKTAAEIVARQLYPRLELPPGADADAVLIAHYAREKKQWMKKK